MSRQKLTEQDLKSELYDIRERFPRLVHDDQLFVLWFLRAFITEDETEAADSLTGGKGDKGVDAVLLDRRTKNVFIVQGKYREKLGGKNEHRADVTSFAQLAVDLSGDHESFDLLRKDLLPEVEQRLVEARRCVLKEGYRLQLYYVTIGKCSKALQEQAMRIVRGANCYATFQLMDGHHVLLLLSDYLDGVAPPVPALDLDMEGGQGVEIRGVFHRYDHKTDIESWVFSMTAQDVAALFNHAGNRLFARNVRGFLGSTEINEGMEETLENEPEYFWYYNNGITVVCDDAEKIARQGKDILHVTNPQVINGQQTTRMLAKVAAQSTKASVQLRVIRVPRGNENGTDRFETLVSRIVSATNWQNEIRPSDLMSNDRRQIEIERQLRKLGYWYVRKRQTKSEARRTAASQRYYLIRKDELAQAVAGCEFDPVVVRKGKEGLFEERWYGQVFPTSDPYFYLCRYWLMNTVSYAARHYPERAYPKWLVLNFMWSQLAPLVKSRAGAECFRNEWETDGDAMYYLWQANTAVFKAALQFYRLRRGKGDTALDVSTFFQRTQQHLKFQDFWNSSANSHRKAFQKAWRKFKAVLAEEAGN